jgi:hypothetical protein
MEACASTDPGPCCEPLPVLAPAKPVQNMLLLPQSYIRVVKDSLMLNSSQQYLINNITLEVVSLEGDGWEYEVVPTSLLASRSEVHIQVKNQKTCQA